MLKKMIAIITSVIILLTPIQASAVTWGEIVNGLQASDTFTSGDGETAAARTSEGEYVISGGQIDELVEVSTLQFSDSLKVLFQNIKIKQLNAYADSGKTIAIILGSGSEVDGKVDVIAEGKATNLSLTNEGKMGSLSAGAHDQAQATIKNNGEITRGMNNVAHGEGSRLEFVNDKEGRIAEGMDNNAVEKGELVFTNNGTISGEDLFNGAFDGGVLKNTNNGTMNVTNDRLHNYARGGGSFVESTNNGTINGEVMNQADYEGSRNVAANHGTVNGQYEFYTGDGGEVVGENNGTVNSLYAGADGGQVSAVNNGKVKEEIRADASHKSMKADVTVINNGEADRMYVSAGENGMLNVENNGRLTGDGKTLITIKWEDGESKELSGKLNIDAWDKGATVNVTNNGSAAAAFIGAADGANASLKNDGQIGNGEDVPLSSYAAENGRLTVTGSGSLEPYTLKMEDGTERTVSMIAQFGGNPSAEEIKRRVGEMVQFDSPGDYLVMVITEDENGEAVFHYVPVHIENPQDFEDEDYEAARFRHEMEMKRQEEAIGGVYGSPYWVKQLYLGYHSYNLRLFVGETRENFREKLSWSADGSKSVSLRVNDETPEKLTMRFDEKVLEVLERTNITTVTLLNKSGAAVMQYNVSDLRAAYDQYGLSDADQLVVGGMDDDVMKIGADGQLVPVE